MSEDEQRRGSEHEEPKDEVEAHGTRHPYANDEGGDTESSEDDVELHMRRGESHRREV